MAGTILLLGVDGGGTRCRARLATSGGEVLGEGAEADVLPVLAWLRA